MGQPATQETRAQSARHYGKYRGTVTSNADPQKIGRLKAKVPEILGTVETGWAVPCAPYAGDKSGHFVVPAAGTGVWIEFEAGEVTRPIWTGCFWNSGKVPVDESGAAATPDVKILASEKGLMVALHDDSQTIAISDANGNNILKIEVQAGQATLTAATKVVVDAPLIELVQGASHPLVFGDDLLQYLTEIVQTFNMHMHPGELAIGVLPVTPMLPVAPMVPPTPALLSLKATTG
jgi:uncharacterized protein involved in type VI secretion and phage assembly